MISSLGWINDEADRIVNTWHRYFWYQFRYVTVDR